MSDLCPVCGQALPSAISASELDARIQKIASPALAAEKKKLKEQFDGRLAAELAKTRQDVQQQFQQELREAKIRARQDAQRDVKKQLSEAEKRITQTKALGQKEVDRARKEADDRLKKEIEINIRNCNRENELKLEKLQTQREKEKLRSELVLLQLQGKVDELSRKLERQSGEQFGAEAELDLLIELRREFPADKIEPIGRGVAGADIVQEVLEGTKSAGRIVYECKNTGSFAKSFVIQAKKYKTQYETPHVMIVTRVFPSKGNKGLCIERDIPVVDKRMAVALATVIREGIIEIAKLRLSGKSSDEKSQELHKYIIGDGFRTRFREIADCVNSLREQQQRERTWHERVWQEGSKIHERIAARHREVEAQIGAIVRGRSNSSQTLKLAASSEDWPTISHKVRNVERGWA